LIADGATDAELAEFESRQKVTIPSEFWGYLRAVNGMVQSGSNDSDSRAFSFWPLSRVKPIQIESPTSIGGEELEGIFVFADFLVCSHFYCINMNADNVNSGQVLICGDLLRPITNSFSEFIELYIKDASSLYI